ncbi:TPA: choline-binding protein, partial [Streptococcus pneumoniae]|nr:choline-binding protein [Streptococcus pneumoniae]HEW8869978.1 choline-binding protein [Streptococcus pneumoniae]
KKEFDKAQAVVVPEATELAKTKKKAEEAKAKELELAKKVEEAKAKQEEAKKEEELAKQKVDAEHAEEVAPQAKIAELENQVHRLEQDLKDINESDSEDYVKEGLRAPLQSELDTKKAKLLKLEELSGKIEELDAEIAELEVQLKDAEGNNNVEAYFKEGLEKTTAEKKAELEKAEADLKKAVDEPET